MRRGCHVGSGKRFVCGALREGIGPEAEKQIESNDGIKKVSKEAAEKHSVASIRLCLAVGRM